MHTNHSNASENPAPRLAPAATPQRPQPRARSFIDVTAILMGDPQVRQVREPTALERSRAGANNCDREYRSRGAKDFNAPLLNWALGECRIIIGDAEARRVRGFMGFHNRKIKVKRIRFDTYEVTRVK